MTEISRTVAFGKLNPIAYKAIEGATTFCKLRGNPYVELVHWLHQILQVQDSDLHRIVRHYELDPSRLAADLSRDVIHALAPKHGLDTVSQIAIDEDWSALRLKRLK